MPPTKPPPNNTSDQSGSGTSPDSPPLEPPLDALTVVLADALLLAGLPSTVVVLTLI
jgi:hypothetical protein